MNNELEKILLIGPRNNRMHLDMASGTITLFEDLIKQFDLQNVKYNVVDTNKNNYSNFLFAYISIIFQIIFKQKECKYLTLHSSKDFFIFAPLIILIGTLSAKKTSLRKFGGDLDDIYRTSRKYKRYLLNFILKNIDILFFETKYLVKFFSEYNQNVFWFPNVRSRDLVPNLPRSFHRKFVFMSHIRKEKGIDELIAAIKLFGTEYTIDIYGLILDKKYTKAFFEQENISYKGALEPQNVLSILNEYDVLILPSYKEGYPGIVIEAYSLGIPVITTNLRAIKEIVIPYQTGILVAPKNVDELVKAVRYFNIENYTAMSYHANIKFDNFQSGKQSKLYIERIVDV